jgi:hypothetical protein
MSATWVLQQAVFAALAADAGVIAHLGSPPRLFDEVPRDAAMPYVVIGEAAESEWNTATDKGASLTFTVTAWSRSAGFREVKEIAGAVRAVLDGGALTLSGAALIDLRFEATRYLRESDGITRRAELSFRGLVEF